jgi:HAE1 family hydrophobic/amphiphilic exporter-1
VNISGLAIRQPVTVAVGVILILMAGTVALSRIPVQLTPNVEDTIVAVTTRWEGASPQEIEQDVVDRQEEKLQGIANLKSITSVSQQGQGTIRLEFAVGISKEQALREVSDKLREVPDYPTNVDEPVINASDPETRDYIAWIIFTTTDPTLDIRTLNDFAEDRIKAVLDRVPGVSEINVLGGREREVHIRFDPVLLAQRGITLSDLAAAVQRTNRNVSAGELPDGKLDVRLRTVSQFTGVDQVEGTVIRQTEAGPVFLRDVARVVETYKEPVAFVHSEGRPVVAINAQKEVGANVMEVMAGLKAAIAKLNRPDGVLDTEARVLGLHGKLLLGQVYDQTVYIDDALALVRNNIWLGGSLAIAVLLLFLRSIRTAGIIAFAIPISVVGAVVAMVAMGRSINVISLAGMAFAVGMVVDNAIVVLENVFRHLEMGKPAYRAAYDGAREVWGAVLASTLTTLIVFVPILLVEEEAGQLFRDIALAICAAVALSLLVSMTVIPTTAARLLKPVNSDRRRPHVLVRLVGQPFRPFGAIPGLLGRFVYRVCGSVLARLAIVVFFTGASLVGTYLLIPPSDYLPTGNRNLIIGLMFPPPGYNLEQEAELGRRVEETIRPFWEAGELPPGSPERREAESRLPAVPTFDMVRMAPGQPVVPPPLDNYFLVSFAGTIFHGGVSTVPERVVDLVSLFNYATRPEVLPGVLAFAQQLPLFRLGGRTGTAVKINFSGPQLDLVTAAAEGFLMKMMQRFGPRSVQPDPSNFNLPGPEIQVIPDRVRLAEVGLAPDDLGLAVQANGDGAIVGEYRIGGQNIDLKIIADDSLDRRYLGDLADIPVATRAGKVVPLSSVADLREVSAAQQINRVSRLRAVTLQFTPPEGLPLEQAIQDVEGMIDESRSSGAISPLVETSYTGSASKLAAVQEALMGDGSIPGTLRSSLALALIATYLLMCVLFQSFIRPLVICFSVPLATLGGFAALALVHYWSATDPYLPLQKLDVLTMLGFVILIGVVVNNAILIVHQALNFMRGEADTAAGKREPLPHRQAIAEAVRTRVRPIFMSTFTSVGGMLPLVLMPGSGSELYRGLGSVVIGGLLVSTLFTLFLVPCLFSLVSSAQERLGLLGRKEQREKVLSSAGIGGTAGAVLLAVCLGLAPGCSLFRAERDPDSVERMLREIVQREVHLETPEGAGWQPPAGKSEVDAALKERLPELERIAGPESFRGQVPELGHDLHGRPQQSSAIDLEGAVRAAVENNLGIRLVRLDPDIAERDVTRADAAFDSTLFATFDFAKLDEPGRVPVINGIALGTGRSASESAGIAAGVQKRFATGATVTVDALLERLENNTRGIDFVPDPAYSARTGLSLTQPLLRGLGAEVNRSDVLLAESARDRAVQRLKAQMLAVIAATEGAYWDLVLAHRTLSIQQRLLDQGRKVKAVLEARQAFDARQAEYSDAIATVSQREASQIRAQRLVKLASDRLKAVMNDPRMPLESEVLLDPADLELPEPLRVRLADALRTAVAERPEVRSALLDIEDARLRERVASNLLLPQLDLSGGVVFHGLDGTAGDSIHSVGSDNFADYLVGLSFAYPLGNRAAVADRERAMLEKDRFMIACRRVVVDVILDVKTALREVQTTYELIEATRANRIAATENLRTLLVEEEENRKLTPEFLNLKFDRQNRLALAQLQEAAALADYRKALADYFRAVGTGLEVNRVEFRPRP